MFVEQQYVDSHGQREVPSLFAGCSAKSDFRPVTQQCNCLNDAMRDFSFAIFCWHARVRSNL